MSMNAERSGESHPYRVLVVDDDVAVASVIVEMLAAMGYNAMSAEGLRSALTILPMFEPNVVITDMVMPDGDGMELVLRLARRTPRPLLIAMSGNPTGIQFLRASRILGVKAVLRKPFSRTELEQALIVTLDRAS